MKIKATLTALCLAIALTGCAQALQRGMADQTYVSTARPNISLQARDLPLMAHARGICNMTWTGVLGGLPIDVWLAVYGQGGLAPLAIVGQAQLPSDWVWDASLARPFSVDEGHAIFAGVAYDAWTYIVPHDRDPFMALVTGAKPDGQPQLWLARAFASRFNFNQDKVFLEYREPLPADITSLTSMHMGRDSFLRDFARRAEAAFSVGSAPGGVRASGGNASGVQWRYMDQNFLGTMTRQDPLGWD